MTGGINDERVACTGLPELPPDSGWRQGTEKGQRREEWEGKVGFRIKHLS